MAYLWALGNGEVVEAEYNRVNDTLSTEQVREELIAALNQFGHTATCEIADDNAEVYNVSIEGIDDPQELVVCIKEMTPGGRSNLNNEQRIQQLSSYFNYAYNRQQQGEKALSLGVYKRDGHTVFCAWEITRSNAEPRTPISRQVKIDTIAQAMKEGFAQQERGHGKYVCAFRKEFIYFYIKNADWLHGSTVDELAEHLMPAEETGTIFESDFARNRIVFGAPGTGKSYTLNEEKNILLADGGGYERVTFHPDYSYAHFVGTYKPVPSKNEQDEEIITYEYVPGPFMRLYVKALQSRRTNNPLPFLLLIEEINRANMAAVFGDVFQLLDRKDNVSEYSIQASEDIKNYLAKPENLGGNPEDYAEIQIPDNMFIWATMNSADQGVFPMDTAFKRRWYFTYIGINDNDADFADKEVVLGTGAYQRRFEWNRLRKAINDRLAFYKINEDKQLGPHFLSKESIMVNNEIDVSRFSAMFKSKVIMYLFDDAAKQKVNSLFGGCDERRRNRYSSICEEFDSKGIFIFETEISNQFSIEQIVPAEGEQQ